MRNLNVNRLVSTSAIALILNVSGLAHASGSALSGRYTVVPNITQNCLNIINGAAGVSFGAFNAGDSVLVLASPTRLVIEDLNTRQGIAYKVGTINETGPVSDGPSSDTNEYVDGANGFSSGPDNLNPGDNFAKTVYQRVAEGIVIEEVLHSTVLGSCPAFSAAH